MGTSKRDNVQGEGNYEATERYDEAQRKFVKSGKVEAAARAAQPKSKQEADDMQRAEQAGRSHAKGEDPAVKGSSGGSGSRKK